MDTSHATPELFAALAVAQGKVENATKGSQNPHFKSRYADLAEILNTVRPVFAAEGLALVQSTGFDGARVFVTTLLGHKSGGYVTSEAACVPAKSDAQGIGAATTYLRRYSLAAMAGIAQEDDDGNAAAHAMPPEAITPTAGFWEMMHPETQTVLLEVAANVREHLEMGDAAEAIKYVKSKGFTHEQTVALWTRFSSKERATLKLAEKAAQKKEAA